MIRDIRVVVLMVLALLWQTSAVAMPSYCSMGDDAGSMAATSHDAAEHHHAAHENMHHTDNSPDNGGDCCGAENTEGGCAMVGCALSVQMLTPNVASPVVADPQDTGIAFHLVVFPQTLVFPFLRPPIA